MKKYIPFLFLPLFFIPSFVLASSGSSSSIPVSFAIGLEAFISIHMSVFVLKPISKIISQSESKKIFWILFGIRAAILIIFDFFITTYIVIFDFLAVFVGAFIIVPILIAKKNSGRIKMYKNNQEEMVDNVLKCKKCGKVLNETYKFCTNCGTPFEVENDVNTPRILVSYNSFDPIFKNSEDKLVEEFIKREMQKAEFDINSKLIPSDVLKRKNILNVIFAVLLFVYISLIFFHFPIVTYIVGLVILIAFFFITRKYDLLKYIKKELKSRPSEKISNVVMSVKSSLVPDNIKKFKIVFCLAAILISGVIFYTPKIFYEKADNGYSVRFYAFGITNFTKAKIPNTYKGENVVGLRGNTFSNMPLLKEVELPDTIKEIRGQAFKNNFRLKNVNIPSNLEYLGGGAFYNCVSLTNIEFPDSLTYMGGEAFYNASSLESIKLSNNISEIRGNTFEECSSLKSIVIPDNVTRIGGHAFYGCSELSSVEISQNSNLQEIGSSAFRLCDNLKSITIPKGVDVNSRAFKESPTKVKRYGEANSENTIDEGNYENNTFLYIITGETREISKYKESTSAYKSNARIKLESIKENEKGNDFYLLFEDKNGSKTIVINKKSTSVKINENIVVEISGLSALYNNKGISLDVYYN